MTTPVRPEAEERGDDHSQDSAETQRAEPEPWVSSDDAKGWRVVARGKRQPRAISVSVSVAFDPAQSAWLSREAQRTGLDYDALIRQLVDAQRGSEAAPALSGAERPDAPH